MSLTVPNIYTAFNLPPPKGILLYGPSGTGKTTLAKYLSSIIKANFIPIRRNRKQHSQLVYSGQRLSPFHSFY